MLKADRKLLSGAVLEAVRHSSVVRWFARVAVEDYVVEGYVIPKGSRVMIMYASANRDERQYSDPDHFNIKRDARMQLAWGSGPHQCGGMYLATLEMELLVEALLDHCDSIKAGEPELMHNMGLYGYSHLPLELRADLGKSQ